MENWREALTGCGNSDLCVALVGAIEELLAKDRHSLEVDASERHLAAELSCYLKQRVPMAPDGDPWQVHVEYNRKGTSIKTINGLQIVVPDIIMHRVGTQQNFLAIELKKGTEPTPNSEDILKLAAYRRPDELNYQHALFLRLGVGADAGRVSCVAWV